MAFWIRPVDVSMVDMVKYADHDPVPRAVARSQETPA